MKSLKNVEINLLKICSPWTRNFWVNINCCEKTYKEKNKLVSFKGKIDRKMV